MSTFRWLLPTLGALALAMASGCFSAPTFKGEPVTCVSDTECSKHLGERFQCNLAAGLCVRAPAPDGGHGGAGGSAGDGGTASDGGETTLNDGGTTDTDGGDVTRGDGGSINRKDGGNPDPGRDGGFRWGDGGVRDGAYALDAGLTCPDPCTPPTLELLSPAADATVTSPVEFLMKVLPGSLPIDQVFCDIVPVGTFPTAYAVKQTDGNWLATFVIDTSVTGGTSFACTAVDLLGNPGTKIIFLTVQ